jgi:hypothetical protein
LLLNSNPADKIVFCYGNAVKMLGRTFIYGKSAIATLARLES